MSSMYNYPFREQVDLMYNMESQQGYNNIDIDYSGYLQYYANNSYRYGSITGWYTNSFEYTNIKSLNTNIKVL